MSELPKNFEAKLIEENLYQFWLDNGFFTADPSSNKPRFCIMIPPPNVTGILHIGHALVNTLQDIIVRFKRMQGYDVLWLPGTDHAGISTQTIVEKHLMKTENKRRTDYSREGFLEHVWQWKEWSEQRILDQLKRLGCSCDWSRTRFTMDEGCNKAVLSMFKKLYDAGLIYKGKYLVNWDPVTETALADDEVEYEEKERFLTYFKYPIENSSEYVVVATTRPETMLGDTAVCVHPDDERYRHLIGKMILLPLVNRPIPIIADHTIDQNFGTGAVKITPAHDHNDYILGVRHNLPMINIMTSKGYINDEGGRFQGLSMQEARIEVVNAMKAEGFLVKQEPYKTRVGVSYRSKAIIEPYLSAQWFMRLSKYKDILLEAVEKGQTKLVPAHWIHTWQHWIENLRDWCISRQLWWGHRIPIWYHKDDPSKIICSDTDTIPEEVAKEPENWYQDTDVLDTWFSSSLWPMSTLGWPENTVDFHTYYPINLLITAHDIIFFWVARMMVMGHIATGKMPFPETFLHGLIYGKSYFREKKDGGVEYVSAEERKSYEAGAAIPSDVQQRFEKMSKTKGNIIDPLEMIDQYGADALRLTLAFSATYARQIDLDNRRFEEFRNFMNKIWNGSRFVLMNIQTLSLHSLCTGIDSSLLQIEDHWILSKLSQATESIKKNLESYAFDMASAKMYHFFWDEFCAWYVETTKPILFEKVGNAALKENKQKLLLIVLTNALCLMHPFIPYITEALFQTIKQLFPIEKMATHSVDNLTKETLNILSAKACIAANFPNITWNMSEETSAFETMIACITALRNIRAEMKIAPQESIAVHIYAKEEKSYTTLAQSKYLLETFTKATHCTLYKREKRKDEEIIGSFALVEDIEIWVEMSEASISKEQERLEKEYQKVDALLIKTQGQLDNPQFISKAPAQLVAKQKETVEQLIAEKQKITEQIKRLQMKKK